MIDATNFKGSDEELRAFIDQRYARLGAAAYQRHGRGLVTASVADDGGMIGGAEYFTLDMLADDDTVTIAGRELVKLYDPATQGVVVYLNERGDRVLRAAMITISQPQ